MKILSSLLSQNIYSLFMSARYWAPSYGSPIYFRPTFSVSTTRVLKYLQSVCRSRKLSSSIQVSKSLLWSVKSPLFYFIVDVLWRNGLWSYRLGYCGSGLGSVANPSVCGNVPAGFGQGIALFYKAKQLLDTQKKEKLPIRASRRPASYEASHHAVFFFILPLLPPF